MEKSQADVGGVAEDKGEVEPVPEGRNGKARNKKRPMDNLQKLF
jgi:hypothetical protein